MLYNFGAQHKVFNQGIGDTEVFGSPSGTTRLNLDKRRTRMTRAEQRLSRRVLLADTAFAVADTQAIVSPHRGFERLCQIDFRYANHGSFELIELSYQSLGRQKRIQRPHILRTRKTGEQERKYGRGVTNNNNDRLRAIELDRLEVRERAAR